MKYAYLFSLVLFVSTGLQSMKTEKKQLPNLKHAQNILSTNVKISAAQYLLETWSKDWNIDSLFEKSRWATDSEEAVKEAIEEYRDKDGNTVTHFLVYNGLADYLYACATKESILFTENHNGETPLDLAIILFSNPKAEMFKQYSNNNKKCCLSILCQYINKKKPASSNVNICNLCCDKHNLLTKKLNREG